MTESATGKKRNYAAFDDDIETRGFDFGLVVRLLKWMRPYPRHGFMAIAFVLLAASAAVLSLSLIPI